MRLSAGSVWRSVSWIWKESEREREGGGGGRKEWVRNIRDGIGDNNDGCGDDWDAAVAATIQFDVGCMFDRMCRFEDKKNAFSRQKSIFDSIKEIR